MISGEICGCHNGGTPGMEFVETKDAVHGARHLTPATQNDPAFSVHPGVLEEQEGNPCGWGRVSEHLWASGPQGGGSPCSGWRRDGT